QILERMWSDPKYREQRSGPNSHFWRDGSATRSKYYQPDFSEALKQKVRDVVWPERDLGHSDRPAAVP
ncbi:MAG: hypothetical protein KKH61_19020, partial [Gammaproteobacteria bacterium]|nr:hypothetical protein [Gammaproteobacteria bacterium]